VMVEVKIGGRQSTTDAYHKIKYNVQQDAP